MNYIPEPINLTVHLLFGSQENPIGWVNQYEFPDVPSDGAMLALSLDGSELLTGEMNESTIYTQVLYRHVNPENPNDAESPAMMIVYGGYEHPEESFVQVLQGAKWQSIPINEVEDMFAMCASLPLAASIHNILLIVGYPETEGFQVWEQILEPNENSVPSFGRRLLLDPVDSAIDATPDLKIDDEGNYDERDINPLSEASLKTGAPVVVIYSEMVGPGIADILYWTKSLGDIGGLDLMAEGWSQIKVPEDFDPEVMDIADRIHLALGIVVMWKEDRESKELDENGMPYLILTSYDIENPILVDPKLYDLLPEDIVEKCKDSRAKAGLDSPADSPGGLELEG